MSLTLKLVTDDETYRLPLTRQPSYRAVVQAVIDFLGPTAASLVDGSLLLKYADEEGDLCVLTAATFNDFLRLQGGQQAKVLKLELVKKERATTSSHLQQAFSDTTGKKDHSVTCDGRNAVACAGHREESFRVCKLDAPTERDLRGKCKSGHEGLDAVLTLAGAAVSAQDQPNFFGALAAGLTGLTLGALAANKGPGRCGPVGNHAPGATVSHANKENSKIGAENAKTGAETEGVLQHEGQTAATIQEAKPSNKSGSLAWGPAWGNLNESNAKRIAASADVKHKMWMRLKAGLNPEQRADEITQIEALSVMQAEHQGIKFKGTFSIITKKHPTAPFTVEAELWLSSTRVWRVNTCRILEEEFKPQSNDA